MEGEGSTTLRTGGCSIKPTTKHYWLTWGLLSLEDGVLLRKFSKRDGTGEFHQIIAPRAIQKELLHHLHKGRLGGHLGQRCTMEHLLQNYYWHEMQTDAELYVQQCEECQRVKETRKQPRAPLGEMPVGGPLDRVATDIMGPLPKSAKGNTHLVATDHFTKWVEILPIPDTTAETCADYLLNEVFARFGTPLMIHSDQGATMKARLLQTFAIYWTSIRLEHLQGDHKAMARQNSSTEL